MATRHGASKRQKERRREEKRKDKEVRRVERKNTADERGPVGDGEDPDLIGIVPGPQPPPEGLEEFTLQLGDEAVASSPDKSDT